MNIPRGRRTRYNATIPLALLVVDESEVVLTTRGLRWPEVRAKPDELRAAFPLRGRLLVFGVGLELMDGRLLYFWTRQRGRTAALSELERCGFPVDRKARAAEALWPRWAGGPSPQGPERSGLPMWLVRLICLTVLAGVGALGLALVGLFGNH